MTFCHANASAINRRALQAALAPLMHRRSGTLYEEAMIVAMTKVHQPTVVTRILIDFGRIDVPLIDPCAVRRSQP